MIGGQHEECAYEVTQLGGEVGLAAEEAQADAVARKDLRALVRGLKDAGRGIALEAPTKRGGARWKKAA